MTHLFWTSVALMAIFAFGTAVHALAERLIDAKLERDAVKNRTHRDMTYSRIFRGAK